MILKDYHDYTFYGRFSRYSWGYLSYAVARCGLSIEKTKWDTGIGYAGSSKDHVVNFILIYKDYKKVADKVLKLICNKSFAQETEDEILASKNKMLANLIDKNPIKLSNEELIVAFEKIFEGLPDICKMAWMLRSVDFILVPKLQAILKDKNVKDIDEALALLSVTNKDVFVVEEEREVLKLASLVQSGQVKVNSDSFNQAIETLWDNYKLNTLGVYNEQLKSKRDYTDSVKNLTSEADKTLKNMKTETLKAKQARDKLIDSLKLDKDQKILVKTASEIPYLKDVFKKNWNDGIYASRPYFEELAKRIKSNESEVKNYWPDDIKKALSGQVIKKELVEERIKHHIFFGYPDILDLYQGQEADEFEQKYLQIEKSDQDQLNGRVACKGRGQGTVKVVHGANDFHKVQEGDILVVGNTTPDYVVILKKVAAIVAEEGGITAHVSVISRELSIPAIVGVSSATAILKDGDKVEVDADNGVVRILKK